MFLASASAFPLREAVKNVIEDKRELDQAVSFLHENGVCVCVCVLCMCVSLCLLICVQSGLGYPDLSYPET